MAAHGEDQEWRRIQRQEQDGLLEEQERDGREDARQDGVARSARAQHAHEVACRHHPEQRLGHVRANLDGHVDERGHRQQQEHAQPRGLARRAALEGETVGRPGGGQDQQEEAQPEHDHGVGRLARQRQRRRQQVPQQRVMVFEEIDVRKGAVQHMPGAVHVLQFVAVEEPDDREGEGQRREHRRERLHAEPCGPAIFCHAARPPWSRAIVPHPCSRSRPAAMLGC